ncbi:SDR family NAD(P)-dependent oxidoreductase [Mycetohabitans endofungorum]|uniref:SDR family NAD(P)-dependent oxidoreductase n=1 Tax=Mycetohabitans endofungorum TaxID=417203 RepID=UPI0030CE5232
MEKTIANDLSDISLPTQRRAGQRQTVQQQTRRQIGGSVDSGAQSDPNAGKVAIVGFAGRFPGADNTEEFWHLLVQGRSAIGEFPYWNLPGIAERRHLRKEFACPGGFIKDPMAFDADFFKISAREAEAMDPQHRIVLEQTWAAFEDAGIPPQSLRGSDTGVYIGVSSADYNGLLARTAAGAHDATGNAHSIIANRISYLFDFHGPSAPVDTACSSSLVAVYKAAQAILNGDCTVAVAGGVNLCFEPMVFIGAAKAGMLSPTGRCKTFAADADGYVRGEGVGVLIVKDYKQALADGDNIVATIIGAARNHGGHANSLTAPNSTAQANLIKQACRGVDINSIGYIEVHGTGTRLGDPIEISGLKQAFAELGRSSERRCYLGSVKTNIGHLESAAGIAGLIKTLLVLKHGYLPKSLHSEQLNPYIDLAGSPFEVLQQAREWPQQSDTPRRAGVSSFGFGGTNAHIVLEAVEPPVGVTAQGSAATIFPLSARTPEALKSRIKQLIDFIAQRPQLALPDLAASLQLGREAMECRLAIVADSRDSLLDQLGHYLANGYDQRDEPAGDVATGEVLRALQQQDRDTLLALWCRGATVDWRQLYPDGRARRIPLPTYPFNREIYWISDAPVVEHSGEPILHPLVQRNTSDLAGQRFSSRFNGNEFFFDEHRVNGVKILPGVAYLEMARAAIELSLADDDALVQFKHIAWQHPMRHDGGELSIDIELSEQDNGEILFEIFGANVDGPSYCRGVALVGAAQALPPLNLPAIAAATEQQRLAPQQCYQIFGEMGLDYGEHFRGISELQAGNGQVLAKLALPCEFSEAGKCDESLRLPPGLLDSALQAALGLALVDPAPSDARRQPLVPFALDGVILGDLDLLGNGCYAWVRYAVNHHPGRINKLDVDLCDAQGRVALRLLGFSSKRLDSSQAKPLVMAPVWRDKAPRQDGEQHYNRQLILLAGSQPIVLDKLADCCQERISGRQINVERLPAAAEDPACALQSLASVLLGYLKENRSDSLVQLVLLDSDHGPRLSAPVFASLQALLKTAKNEGLVAAAQSIEVSGRHSPELLAQLLIENSDQEDERVRYQHSVGTRYQRQVASWQETALAANETAPWRAGGVYLLTGGVGGLGLLLAEAIAREAHGAKLILASRSADQLSSKIAERIAHIKKLGAQVQLEALDVADRTAVDELIVTCEREFGGIHGIFHCAGLTRDSLLSNKSEADWGAVLMPKVAGALNLDRASAHLALDCFVLFSSVSAVIGNVGQGDYALANAFLDEFTGWRNRQTAAGHRHGRTLAVNWPLWRNGGMQIDPQREQLMVEHTGIEPLSDHGGLELLRRALADANAPERLMVLEGNTAKIKAFIAAQWHEPVAAMFDEPGAAEQSAAPTTQVLVDEPSPTANANDEPVHRDLTEPAIRYFKQLLSTTLKRPVEKIDSDGSFERYGVDSIILTELTTKLEQSFGSLPNTLLYEYQTVRELSEYFIRHHRDALQQRALGEPVNRHTTAKNGTTIAEAERVEPIAVATQLPARKRRRRTVQQDTPSTVNSSRELAIVGISGRYPGAEDLETFWHKLAGGEDLISEVPTQRWDHQAYFAEQRDRFDKTYCKWGGFLDGVEDFDPLFFNLSPREAEIINPNDRLFIETCWNLLESAGLTRQRLKQQYQQQVGVFVGVMYQQYQAFEADFVKESLVSVTSYSAIANRVSYFFDFQGPSLAIDTMCSSSISAIHAAGEALRNGDCRLAIAGGVNLTLHPKKYIGLSIGKVLGSHASSRSFADGDGYLPAEGVGAVLLKTLADAERDGDRILAVIKSTAVNHGGHTHGFSMPSAKAQAALIDSNFKRAGVDPRTISYVESAANGSAMGDAIELSALNRVFGQAGVANQSCAIGSVKSNIGHAEAASGMSQLSKLVLQLQHQQLAPSLLLGPLNPKLDFDNSPFVLQRELGHWPQPVIEMDGVRRQYPRRAALSAFGAGGSNAHLVLEEYQKYQENQGHLGDDVAQVENGALYIVPMSAKSVRSLHQGVMRLARHLDTHPNLRLNDVAYTLQTGREAMQWRLALLVKSMDELRAALCEIGQVLNQSDGIAALAKLDLPLFSGNIDEVPATTASLLCGPGADALSHSLIAADERQQLALLWTQGGEVPWDKLAENTSAGYGVKIVPLPTYAFDKKRYWLEQSNTPTTLQGNAIAASVTQQASTSTPVNVTDDHASHTETAAERGLRVLAGLLGMQPEELSLAKPLSVYGADSIVMVQLAMQLQAEMDPELALAKIQQCVTIQDLLDLLAERGERTSAKGPGLPVKISELFTRPTTRFLELQRLNTVDDGQPIFWFHGALGGSEIYQELAHHIDRPFFGLQAKGWMTEREPLQGIEAMAAYYVQAIQSVQPHGPYDLGGYSLGGMLAYEVTRQLQASEETVTTLVMLDSPDVTGERTAKLADKTRLLQAVNMSLQMTISDTPERFAEVLIHRDEVDLSLSHPAYRQQLMTLARQRGLKISDDRLQHMMEQVARIQQSYQVEQYRILPLPKAEEVACYYFRNASGLWMGDLEPYFSTDSREFAAFNHTNYWQEWQRQLPSFEMIDVDSSSHMTLLTEPEVFDVVAAFCVSLYAKERVKGKPNVKTVLT